MGFWSGVCEFDPSRYRDVVVPAFRAGETHPVVRSALEAMHANRRWSYDFADLLGHTGLADVMAHFNEDLTACDLGRDLPPDWDYWLLADLFECVLTRETVRAFANLAKTGNDLWHLFGIDDHPGYHFPEDDDGFPGTSAQPRLQELLIRLDQSYSEESYWQHGSGGYGEGICGWLEAGQTRELATLLPRPFAPDGSLEWDRQHRFWIVVDGAVSRGNGLLWGRDLGLFYDRSKEYFRPGETMPAEIEYPYEPPP